MSEQARLELNSTEEHLTTYYPRFVFYVGIALITGTSGIFLMILIYQLIVAWQRDSDNFDLQCCLAALHDTVAWAIGRRAIHLTSERLLIEAPGNRICVIRLKDLRSIELQPKMLGGNVKLWITGEKRGTVLKVIQATGLASEIQQACLAAGGACPA